MPEEEVGPIKRGLGLLGLRTPKVITENPELDSCLRCFGLDWRIFLSILSARLQLCGRVFLGPPMSFADFSLLFRASCPLLIAAVFRARTFSFLFLLSLSDCQASLVFSFFDVLSPVRTLPQLRIGLLDWGQTKELGREDREKVANLILAVSSRVSPDIVRWCVLFHAVRNRH